MAKLIVRSAEHPNQIIELKPGVNRFGRGSANDYTLEHPAVSDPHCELLVDNGLVFVRDLNSTNGTFIDQNPITESALYAGQTLRIGPLEMTLDAEPIHIAIPELPRIPVPEFEVAPTHLADGYAACAKHPTRHAVWDCTKCSGVYCNECIRKLRRVGGSYLKLCPACSSSCRLSSWSEMLKAKDKSIFRRLLSKVKGSFSRTAQLLNADGTVFQGNPPPPAPHEDNRPGAPPP